MINIILSIMAGALAWVLSSLFLFDSNWTGVWLFLLVGVIAFVALNRYTGRKVSAIMGRAQALLQNLPKLPSEQARKNQMDKAAGVIKDAYAYKNFVPFLGRQLDSQLGAMYYVQRRFREAEPYLSRSFLQPGTSRAMYACMLFKRGDEKAMREQFELSLKFDKRTPLLWNVYAWCLCSLGHKDEALKTLNRSVAATPGDPVTLDNIDRLKNGGRMNMRPYGEQWYQFWLEDLPRQQVVMMPQGGRGGFRR